MKRKIETMNSLTRTLSEMILAIVIFALFLEGIGLFFVKEKVFYTVGILYGAAIGIGLAVHMAHNLNDALDWDEENARKIAKRGSFFRYLVTALLMGAFAYFRIGNFLACILGIMCLKAAAYAQPLVHKIINHILKINEEGGSKNAIIDDEDADDLSEWIEHRFYDTWLN